MRQITVYTDGAACPNPGKGGYSAIILCNGERTEISGGYRLTTNNRMELMGPVTALKRLNGRCKVTIYSDARYVGDMFNGGNAERWRKKGWMKSRRQAAKNSDLWNELLNLAAGHEVRFVHVKGHSGNELNTRCDELAVQARRGADLPADEWYERQAGIEASEEDWLRI